MKEIQLTQNQVALIDDEDYEEVIKHKWCATKTVSNNYYAVSGIKIGNKKTTRQLHRFIMNPPVGTFVDHIDHNGLNCTRSNMRICTRSENCRNRLLGKDNTSGYKGVFFNNKKEKYVSTIYVNNKPIRLGYYNTAIEAAIAYNNAAIKHHKEFANLNKISDGKNNKL